jgi:hypothetical protein
VFISANHAARHGAVCAVLNGLDWDEYAPFEATEGRTGRIAAALLRMDAVILDQLG